MLFLVFSLIMVLVGIRHVSITFNHNGLVLIMIIVVTSIFIFVRYYMVSDVSNENFKVLKVLFLLLIIVILTSYSIVMFVG